MALTGTTNEERIWNFCIGKGMSKYGAAGLMGNIYAESGLVPTNLQNSFEKKLGYTDAAYTAAVDNGSYKNFVRDSAGYGLCQWTYWSRKQALLAFCQSKGTSIGDLEMQLEFMYKELSENYGTVLSELRSATSVLQASNAVLLKYERPADQSSAVQSRRASYGQVYYDKFASKTTQTEGGTTMGYTNSSLVDCVVKSPNHSGRRTHSIDRLTPHCVVGQLSAESIGSCFTSSSVWGKLKSGAGWIYLANASYCTIGSTVSGSSSKPAASNVPYKVRVDASDLRIRSGAGTNYPITGKYTGKGTFTIVEEKAGTGSTKGWGKLKSGAGWISLDYCVKL